MFCCYRVLALYRFKGVLLALIVMGKLRQIHEHTRSRSSISIGMAGKSNARGGPLLGILEEVRKIRLLLFALHPINFSIIDSEKSGLLRN